MLRSALVYASWGWHVHPLRPGGKRPLLTDWPRRATTDPEQVRRWWRRWPEANIGLACGPTGLLAIDLDLKNGVDGLASWEALKVELGIDDAGTPASDTPSGGRHILFSLDQGASPAGAPPPTAGPCPRPAVLAGPLPGNTAGKLGPGIDTRGDGGYIVLPPSRLAANQGPAGTWAWRPEAHPRHCRPQPLPACLWRRLAAGSPVARGSSPAAGAQEAGRGPGVGAGASPAGRLEGITAYASAALREEVRRVAAAAEGTRNDTLNAAAFSLGQLVSAGLLDRAQVERPLILAAGVAGLGEPEAMATARSGLDAGQKMPRALPATLRAAASLATRDEPAPETYVPDAASWMLSLPSDDEGNAQCVARLYGERFLYCSAYGWMEYVGTHWAEDPQGLALRARIIQVLKARQRHALQGERPSLVKATTRSNGRIKAIKEVLSVLLATDVATFDASPDHLNVANGLLDLRTGDLAPHDPGQRFTHCLEVAYDAACDYRPWRQWLRQTVALPGGVPGGETGTAASSSAPPGEAEEFYLQLAVGYSLTGHTSEEALFYLYGPPRSGKGTFTEALLALMGHEPLAAEVPFATFVRNRSRDCNSADLAKLKPCRLVVASEPNHDDWVNLAELKRLTGGNLVYAALKYRDHFTYRPAYKIWLSGNRLPQADVEDEAIWSRLRVIPFPNSHVGREDRSLKARMKAPDMQGQILAWAVDGARAWYKTLPRGLPTPPSIERATQSARDELDEVGQWLDEYVALTGAEDDFVPNALLRASYEAWARQVGAAPRNMACLTQALKAKGLQAGAQRWYQGRSQRGCQGIRLCG